MSNLHKLSIAGAAFIALGTAGAAQSATISDSRSGLVELETPEQLTISNSRIGAVDANAIGSLNVNDSEIGVIRPGRIGQIDASDSKIGAIQSQNRTDSVNLSNSEIGAIETTSSNQNNGSLGGYPTADDYPGEPQEYMSEFFDSFASDDSSLGNLENQGQPSGDLSEFFGSLEGNNIDMDGYPTADDYNLEALEGSEGAIASVPEPSSGVATIVAGAIGGGLMLKRKRSKYKAANIITNSVSN